MEQKSEEKNGVFINGKKQVIELLQRMDTRDKSTLLKNIKARNPSLAKELTELCLCFESIWELDDGSLKSLISQVPPAILGLAVSLTHVKNQRRALGLVSRQAALKAFEIMQKDLTGNRNECLKAQQKILDLAINLNRQKIIEF